MKTPPPVVAIRVPRPNRARRRAAARPPGAETPLREIGHLPAASALVSAVAEMAIARPKNILRS